MHVPAIFFVFPITHVSLRPSIARPLCSSCTEHPSIRPLSELSHVTDSAFRNAPCRCTYRLLYQYIIVFSEDILGSTFKYLDSYFYSKTAGTESEAIPHFQYIEGKLQWEQWTVGIDPRPFSTCNLTSAEMRLQLGGWWMKLSSYFPWELSNSLLK